MAEPYGTDARPAYLDPFHTIVAIEGFGSQFIAVPLRIVRAATLDFQRFKFDRQGVDSGPQDPISGLADAIQCRYIWASCRPLLGGWTGTQWTTCLDGKEPPVPEIRVRGGGSDWRTVDEGPQPTITGLPSLPKTVALSGMLGTTPLAEAEIFAPQARWDDLTVTGSNTFADFTSPNGGNFVKVGSVTIRIIGLAPGGAETVGVIPEGGFVATNGIYPVVQQPLEIAVGGVTVVSKGRTWKGFAASKRAGGRPSISALLPEDPGTMWILCASSKNKQIFPPGRD